MASFDVSWYYNRYFITQVAGSDGLPVCVQAAHTDIAGTRMNISKFGAWLLLYMAR